MNKIKILFNQTLMISTAILFGVGIQMLICHFFENDDILTWPWYVPLSIVLTGFLCSLPTMVLIYDTEVPGKRMLVRIAIHFVLVGSVVSLCGFLFKWYETLDEYLPILIMYIVIYLFVWAATGWLTKSDEKKINAAIKDIQDRE